MSTTPRTDSAWKLIQPGGDGIGDAMREMEKLELELAAAELLLSKVNPSAWETLKADLAAMQARAEEAEQKLHALRADRDGYIETFQHRHAGPDDACARCGLDLRDPIHIRVNASPS